MNGPTMSSTVFKLAQPTLLLKSLVIASILFLFCLLLSQSSAFNTGTMMFHERLRMWSLILLMVWSQWKILIFLTFQFNNSRTLSTIISFLLIWLLVTYQLNWMKQIGFIPKAHDPYFEFIWFTLPSIMFICALFITIDELTYFPRKRKDTTLSTHHDEIAIAGIQSNQIQTLQSQGHYVLVKSINQEKLIRMSLKTAVKLLSNELGLQVHKSWWVRKSQVKNSVRNNRDLHLILHSGESIPVSRSKVKLLRTNHWL